MFLVVSSVFLGSVMLLVVCVFYSFLWKFGVVSGLRSWVSSFECGFLSGGLVECYFSHTYFVLLVFFVLFDLEVSLLLNLPFQGVLFKKFLSYVFFLLMLGVGFSLEVNKGYVRWSY